MKLEGNVRTLRSLAVAVAFALAAALAPDSGSRVAAQVPPPPPLPNPRQNTPNPAQTTIPITGGSSNATPPSTIPVASPAADESAPPARGRRRLGRANGAPASPTPAPSSSAEPAPTATPTSPAFATLDGTWEVQLQYIDHTDYSFLRIAQTQGGQLTGQWRYGGKEYPLSGTYDGRLIKFVVAMADGSTSFSGYVEGASDMVGLVEFPKVAGTPATSNAAFATPAPAAPASITTSGGRRRGKAPAASGVAAPRPTYVPPPSSVLADGIPFTAEHRGAPKPLLKR